MNAIDILVLLAIGGCAILGLMRGFVLETLSLIAWVLAIFAIRLFHAPAAELLSAFVGNSSGAAMLALVLVFGVTFGVGSSGWCMCRRWRHGSRACPTMDGPRNWPKSM